MQAHFKKPIFISALYDYLNEIDLDKYNFKERCDSEMFKELCRQNTPKEALFWEYILNGLSKSIKTPLNINGKELFEKYTTWCDENKFNKDYSTDIRQFYTKILNKKVSLVKIKGYTFVKFNPAELLEFMYEKQWIERDEIDIDTFNTKSKQQKEENDLDSEFENYF